MESTLTPLPGCPKDGVHLNLPCALAWSTCHRAKPGPLAAISSDDTDGVRFKRLWAMDEITYSNSDFGWNNCDQGHDSL